MQKIDMAAADGLCRLKWEYEKERTGYDDLLALGTADMDYRCPQPILDAITRIASRGHLGYPMIPDLYYEVIEERFQKKYGWKIDAMQSVQSNEGIYISAWNAIDILTVPGDRIAILTPVHFCFRRMIEMNHRKTVECPLIIKDGKYTIDMESLEGCLACDVRVLWICNPHNPVGRAWSEEELSSIARLCEKYNVNIISDDVYNGLTFPKTEYVPMASLSKEISYRTITLYSTSKSYNTTGLKHSFAVIENPDWMKRYRESMDMLDLRYSIDIMGIYALISAYTECDEWSAALQQQISSNHRIIHEALAKENSVSVITADSTYFVWIDMRRLNIPPAQLSYLIEQKEHMIVENGLKMGKGGAGFIRMNLASSETNVSDAARRLVHFIHNC